MASFTKSQVLVGIEKAKTVNVWAISYKVLFTFDHENKNIIVWNAEGDYDAHYDQFDILGIQNEANLIEKFVA